MITTGNIQPRQTKRGGRKWQISIDLPRDPVTGKRVRRFKTVSGTKKEAERAMHEFIRELEKGTTSQTRKSRYQSGSAHGLRSLSSLTCPLRRYPSIRA